MLGQLWFDHLAAQRADCRRCTLLIALHRSRIARDVGRQDRGERRSGLTHPA